MVKKTIGVVVAVLAFFCRTGVCLESQTGSDIFSPTVAGVYLDLADELVGRPATDPEPAMVFLEGAWLLDGQSGGSAEGVLDLAQRAIASRSDYSQTVTLALGGYIDSRCDLSRVFGGFQYLLERLNTRKDREAILSKLLADCGSKNPFAAASIETQLGVLAAERTDVEAAVGHFAAAYRLDPYNRLAYEKLLELSPPSDQWHSESVRILFLRRQFEMNPAYIGHVAAFAEAARQAGLYEISDRAFQYASALFSYFYPGQTLPETISWPWSVCCFQQPRRLEQCIVLAGQSRRNDGFSLPLEAMAGLAAEKSGKPEQADRILSAAAARAEDPAKNPDRNMVRPELLGWFYCFVQKNPEKALAWCNRAYLQEPQNPDVKSLMACAFALNEQWDLAGEYAGAFEKQNPTAAFVMGLCALQQGQKVAALEAFKSAMAMDGDSPVGLRAAEVLKANDSEYIRPMPAEVIRRELEGQFGPAVVPDFVPPEKLFSARLALGGNEFSYGSDLQCSLIVENKGSAPLIIRPGGMVSGDYRLDVAVSGDINTRFTGLLSGSFQPATALGRGEYATIPLNVLSGRLGALLFSSPQADLELEFSLYLDPRQAAPDGDSPAGGSADMPVRAVIRRKGVDLTGDFMLQRLDALAKGQQGQKVRAAMLFAGLLAEQDAAGRSALPYKYYRAERSLLVDAVRRAVADQDWQVRVYAMSLMSRYSLPLDFSMVATVSGNLGDAKWPVRLSALYLLAGGGESFRPVLDWTAGNDPFWLNRKMATSLGAAEAAAPKPAGG